MSRKSAVLVCIVSAILGGLATALLRSMWSTTSKEPVAPEVSKADPKIEQGKSDSDDTPVLKISQIKLTGEDYSIVSEGPVIGYHAPGRRLAWRWIREPAGSITSKGLLEDGQRMVVMLPRVAQGLGPSSDQWHLIKYGILDPRTRRTMSSGIRLYFDRTFTFKEEGRKPIHRMVAGRLSSAKSTEMVENPAVGRPITLCQMVTAFWTTNEVLKETREDGVVVKKWVPDEPQVNTDDYLFLDPLAELQRLPISKKIDLARATLQVMVLDPAWTEHSKAVADFWDEKKIRDP